MSWRDNLRPASFRGVAFQVEGHDLATGRRGQQHEYPQRDKPYFEDLGRKARDVSVEAFVIGDDYMRARDALIEACETGGPGTLVHPYFGNMDVVCTDCRVSESADEGRVARFSLTFLEAGEIHFPTSEVDTATAVEDVAAAFVVEATRAFVEQYAVSGLPGFVAESCLAGALEFVDTVNSLQAGISEAVDDFTDGLSDMIRIPSDFAAGIIGMVDGVVSASADVAKSMMTLGAFAIDVSAIPLTTATRLKQVASLTAIGTLVRHKAIAAEAVALTAVEFDSYQDAITRMQDFVGRVDDETLSETVQFDDGVYHALEAVRASVTTDIQSRAGNLAKITSTTVPELTPALVAAYELYEDATRDDEVVARNGVRHPSFLPSYTGLEVLSS